MIFKPLLAPNNDPLNTPDYLDKLRYPLLVSPKLDGIRCIVKDGRCKSRKMLDLPSTQVQHMFSKYEEFDGEILVGPIDEQCYNRTQSHVMSRDKPGDLKFHVFDIADEDLAFVPFMTRFEMLKSVVAAFHDGNIIIVPHTLCNNKEELLIHEEKCLAQGYEGVMMRDPNGKYKWGRGTFKEGIIYKLKRFQDAEARVIDFEEQYFNFNEAELDELGHTKRSSSKSGLMPGDTLGKFIVYYNEDFLPIPCGNLNHAERKYIWDNKEQYRNKLLKFRYFGYGVKNRPRMPRFIGWRDEIDVSTD